jgi:tRNA 2-selenouridine synthase
MVDINVFRIKGGYKAYRRLVYDYLYRNENYFKNVFVLEGLTGVGKTKILNSFSTENNIIDLEDLANNKGSVFGNIGLDGQPSQKKFDSLIFKKLYHKDNYEMILVEGESKRIGRVFIPDLLWESMNRAKKLYIYDDIENRVKRIIKDYLINSNIMIKEIESAIQKLKSRLGKETVEELINNLYEGEFKDVTLFLLQNYYDKIYNLSNMDEYQIKISSANIEKACEKILIHIRNNCERR